MNKEQQLKCVEIAPRDTKVILAKNALRLFIEIVDPSDVILLLSITSSFYINRLSFVSGLLPRSE